MSWPLEVPGRVECQFGYSLPHTPLSHLIENAAEKERMRPNWYRVCWGGKQSWRPVWVCAADSPIPNSPVLLCEPLQNISHLLLPPPLCFAIFLPSAHRQTSVILTLFSPWPSMTKYLINCLEDSSKNASLFSPSLLQFQTPWNPASKLSPVLSSLQSKDQNMLLHTELKIIDRKGERGNLNRNISPKAITVS